MGIMLCILYIITHLFVIVHMQQNDGTLTVAKQQPRNLSSKFSKFLSNLFEGEKFLENPEDRIRQYETRIVKVENDLEKKASQLTVQEKFKKKLEIAILKSRMELTKLIERHNNLLDTEKSSSTDRLEHSAQILRLDKDIFIYRKALENLDSIGVLYLHGDQMDLKDPQYADALIRFILRGSEYCNGIRIGKGVELADVYEEKVNYNFFEALLEELSNASDPEKVVPQMEFEFMTNGLRAKLRSFEHNCVYSKTPFKRKYEVLLGPSGVLSKERLNSKEGQKGIELSEERKIKKYIRRRVEHRNLYKMCSPKSKGAFEIKLKYSEKSAPKSSKEHPQMMSLGIRKMTIPKSVEMKKLEKIGGEKEEKDEDEDDEGMKRKKLRKIEDEE